MMLLHLTARLFHQASYVGVTRLSLHTLIVLYSARGVSSQYVWLIYGIPLPPQSLSCMISLTLKFALKPDL